MTTVRSCTNIDLLPYVLKPEWKPDDMADFSFCRRITEALEAEKVHRDEKSDSDSSTMTDNLDQDQMDVDVPSDDDNTNMSHTDGMEVGANNTSSPLQSGGNPPLEEEPMDQED